MDRILCAWLPTLAIDNWRRRCGSRGNAKSRPVALVTLERGVRRIFSVDVLAASLGLFAGQKAADAQALAPDALFADADPEADARAMRGLADFAERFSPAVAVERTDSLILDITGLAHLWGGEAELIADLVARFKGLGFEARCAVAGTVGAAWAMAHFSEAGTIARPGGEADALFPLPVTALRLEDKVASQIARLGLVTIGRLAALPSSALTRRFGPEVGLRLDQAFGRAREALAYRRPPTPWIARLKLAEPISAPEDLARVTTDVAALLCERLEREGKGARRLELAFYRVDGRAERLVVGLALPGRSPQAIARLFAPKLEIIDPGFGIEAATLAAGEVERLHAVQHGLETAGETAPEDGLAPLVDRLVNRLGVNAVWRAEPRESHAPERAVARRPALSRATAPGGWRKDRPRPFRLLRFPERIEAMAPIPDDPPLVFTWRGLRRRVRLAEGPERLSEEWWRVPFDAEAEPRVRDYYRVEDESGARFWLFRDGLYGGETIPKWWLHGFFG